MRRCAELLPQADGTVLAFRAEYPRTAAVYENAVSFFGGTLVPSYRPLRWSGPRMISLLSPWACWPTTSSTPLEHETTLSALVPQ
jgi:hypothetical protein